MDSNFEEDIVFGDKINICDRCGKNHICKRCSKNIHVCMFCGKISHECDICGTMTDSLASIKKHQKESKFCKKARYKTSITMEEYLTRFNILLKTEKNNLRRKSIC